MNNNNNRTPAQTLLMHTLTLIQLIQRRVQYSHKVLVLIKLYVRCTASRLRLHMSNDVDKKKREDRISPCTAHIDNNFRAIIILLCKRFSN